MLAHDWSLNPESLLSPHTLSSYSHAPETELPVLRNRLTNRRSGRRSDLARYDRRHGLSGPRPTTMAPRSLQQVFCKVERHLFCFYVSFLGPDDVTGAKQSSMA